MPVTGFVKSLNLEESGPVSDESIFENLGGAGITEDIRLFAGNLAAETRIVYGAANVGDNEPYWEYDGDNWIYIKRKTVDEGTTPFSNRTRIKVGNTNYYVFDSDGFTKFKLYSNINKQNVIDPSTLSNGDLVRSDTVTFQNLNNMSLARLDTIVDSGDGGGTGDAAGGVSTDDGVDSYLTEIYSIGENYALGQNALALFFYKKSRIPRTYEESIFDKRIVFDGGIRITNTEDISATDPTAPGLFIVSGPSSVRAFSDTSNPWYEESSGTNPANGASLATDATRAQVTTFKTQNPNLRNPDTNVFDVVSETGNIAPSPSNAIYKLKVNVNGETYYLLLKQ
jgi:hypothetical protein